MNDANSNPAADDTADAKDCDDDDDDTPTTAANIDDNE